MQVSCFEAQSHSFPGLCGVMVLVWLVLFLFLLLFLDI